MSAPSPVDAAGPMPRWLVWVGWVVVVGLAFVSAVWEAFLTPLAVQWTSGGHTHFVRLPVALVGAVAGNAALTWFTRAMTGRVLTVLGPFAVWTVPMLLASTRTREGDLILTGGNWVSLVTMFAGGLTFAIAAYWLAIRTLPRRAQPAATQGQTGATPG
jgi:hypothetical protein